MGKENGGGKRKGKKQQKKKNQNSMMNKGRTIWIYAEDRNGIYIIYTPTGGGAVGLRFSRKVVNCARSTCMENEWEGDAGLVFIYY